MKYRIVTPASSLPVSVADVKTHLRIESYSDHDDLIESYIESESKTFEQRADLMLEEQTWVVYFNPTEVKEYMCFYKDPVKSVSSIKYYDSDNNLQTMDSGNYTVVTAIRPCEVIITDVPSVYDRSDAFQITFVGGYTTIPTDIIRALKSRIYKIYNDPSDFVEIKKTYFEKVITDYRGYE